MQVLDFSALENNALFFKNLLGNSKLCAVIKNNAYGHGIEHIARFLDGIVDYFAVGSVIEAKQIYFVSKDILILLPQSEANATTAVRCGFVLTVDSFATLDTICKVATKLQTNARVHIKIDSGMTRLGFTSKDLEKLANILQSSPQIVVEGVYSHYYGDNCAACDKQYATFLPCAQTLEQALNKRIIKHIANSGGVLLSDKYHLDMSRVGLGLYGYGNKKLIPVKTVTAQVIAVKDVSAGEVVGYGAKYVASCNSRIAVLNVGYAQGFFRSLVGSYVSIKGTKCKVVAVCMAMIMVEVCDLDVQVGDAVTLLGKGVNISNDGVSIYELLCNLK